VGPTAEPRLAGIDVVAREVEVVEDQLRRNDVTALRGEASFVDPHTLLIESETGSRKVTARHVVIAVGTRPAPPPGVKADGEIVLDSDQVVRTR
jgi:NAD(P) transhydrogenase